MSLFAYVLNGSLVEFRDVPDELHANWVLTGNPKKDSFLPVNYEDAPDVSESEIAEYSWQVNPDSVTQVWTVRAKTEKEMRKKWTAYQFLLRFTAEERAAFRAASLTNANVADFQQLAQAAQEIVSDDPMTVAGMDYLVSQGLLTQARRDEILNG
jgi:hypothetical protein